MSDGEWKADPISLTAPPGAGPDQDRFVVGEELPAELIAYYEANSYTPIGGIIMYHPPDEYEYLILALNAADRGTLCIGTRNTAGIVDCMQIRASAGLPIPRVTFGEFLDNPGQIFVTSTFILDVFGQILIESGASAIFADGGEASFADGSFLFGASGADFAFVDMRHRVNEQNTASTRSATTYANLTNIAGTDFVAPVSGIVTILYKATLLNNDATGGAALTPWVGEGGTVGSGTEFLAASDANAIAFNTAVANEGPKFSGHKTVTGLTGGDTYNVSMRGRALTAGTATFDDIHTTVIPSP